MADGVILSKKDARRTGRVVRQVEHDRSPKFYRRRPRSSVKSGGQVHKAYCKNDAGAATTIDCYLDNDSTGTEISVNCTVCGGGYLNTAVPRLEDGDLIFVIKIGDDWFCISPFQVTEVCDCYVA